MAVLSDAEWLALSSALAEVRSGTGRPFVDERSTVEAVVWRLRNGARWRALPAEFGPWWRAAQLHHRWSRMGIWGRLLGLLREKGRPDLAEVLMDATSIRAHQKAAGAKGGATCMRSAARAAATAPKPA